jgi:hypothetical protein
MSKVSFSLVLAALFGLSAAASAAPYYSVNEAFYANEAPNGAAANPSGAYTYGYFQPSTTTISRANLVHTDAFNGSANVEGYYIPNNFIVPAILINTSASAVTTNFQVTLGSHQILLHAGGLGSNAQQTPYASAVLRYTAQNAGTYDISAIFSSIDRGITDVSVLVNGASIFTASDFGSFNGSQLLALNDTVDFVVGAGSDNSIYNDSTGLYANIALQQAVPEPGSVALVGFGLAALGFARRKKA